MHSNVRSIKQYTNKINVATKCQRLRINISTPIKSNEYLKRTQEEMSSISRWLCKSSSKNMFVKIVHPGGHVELHDRPILAAELLDRNPKCCVAHPTIFQQPHALVSPETTLLLGRKYYVVPLGTIRKLQLKHRRRPRARGGGGDLAAVDPHPRTGEKSGGDREAGGSSSSSFCWLFRNGKNGEDRGKRDEEDGDLGMRIRVASSESSGDNETARMVKRENGGGGGRRVEKEFDGNGGSSSSSPGRISLLSVDNWQPGLNSICEEY